MYNLNFYSCWNLSMKGSRCLLIREIDDNGCATGTLGAAGRVRDPIFYSCGKKTMRKNRAANVHHITTVKRVDSIKKRRKISLST